MFISVRSAEKLVYVNPTLFVVTLAIIVFAIVNVWNTRLSENKGLNVFIIVFIVITVLSFS